MPQNKYRPYYRGKPIAKLASLAKSLNVDEQDLLKLASDTKIYWRRGKTLKKKDGSPRLTHNSIGPLKNIQKRIKSVFLAKVEYPSYILGGISSDINTKRGYIENASLHKNKKILFSEDVKDFFPSTTDNVVHSIWTGVFNFHPDVADVLTKLTTYNNCLPQGWVTSSHLANLALWKYEPRLVEELEKNGMVYSRFVDDVVISSERYLGNKHKTIIVGKIVNMFSRCGYKAKRTKHTIATKCGSSFDENRKMRVGNLNVGSRRVTVPKTKRQSIRAAVFHCERYTEAERYTDSYQRQWSTASGLVASIKSLHPVEAEKLRNRLNLCK